MDGNHTPLHHEQRKALALALQDDLIFHQRTLNHIEYRLDSQVPRIDRIVASSLVVGQQTLPFVYDLDAMRKSKEYRIMVQTISHITVNILNNLDRTLASMDTFLASAN